MARNKVRLNHAGVAAILKSPDMRRAIEDKTQEVARNVAAQGIRVGDKNGGPRERPLPVDTDMETTDRARGVVMLAHAAGLAVQAKHGVLTKAAAAAGLQVRQKR